MNIYDISKQAGVSIATVSRVLNGNSRVSEKTREKVLEIIDEAGYTPNVFARGLGLNSMHTIGVLCADAADIFLASGISYLEQQLKEYAYDMLLCCTGYDTKIKKKYLELLLEKRVDGIILLGSNFIDESDEKNLYIRECAKKVPVFVINGYLKGDNISCIFCEDRLIMKKVTKQYLEQGEQNLLFLGRNSSYSGLEKLKGFIEAHQEKGVLPDKSQQLILSKEIGEIEDFFLERWQEKPTEKVILTADDELAIGVLKAAKKKKMDIPKDLEVIGYNNSKFARCVEPELSSIDNFLEKACNETIGLLMRIIESKGKEEVISFKGELVIRKTSRTL